MISPDVKPAGKMTATPLSVVQLSTYDVVGGAARAAYRLHDGLKNAGVRSQMICRGKRSGDSAVTACGPQSYYQEILLRLRCLPTALEQRRLRRSTKPGGFLLSSDRSEMRERILAHVRTPDIIHLHWVCYLFDMPTVLPVLAKIAPLVWTLHDMNPFSGACHYAGDCTGYLRSCGACPQIGSCRERDVTRRIWERKSRTFERIPPERLHIVTPSRWLATCARASALLARYPVTVIPYGVDTDAFHPADRDASRQVFGVPADAPVVVLVADALHLLGKGAQLLAEAIRIVQRRLPVRLVTIGRECPDFPGIERHQHLGYVAETARLASAYACADVFVCPSLEDNLPNTVLEAMACGVPVVAFDTGGLPDMVRHEATGLLAPPGDVDALAASVGRLLQDESARRSFSRKAREVAEQEYPLQRQAECYLDLYRQLLASPHSAV